MKKLKVTSQPCWPIQKYHSKKLLQGGINPQRLGDTPLINIASPRILALKTIEFSILILYNLKFRQQELKGLVLSEKEIKSQSQQLY
jgi:hypothetical protein